MSYKHFLFLIGFIMLNIESSVCTNDTNSTENGNYTISNTTSIINNTTSIISNTTTIITTTVIIATTTEYIEATSAEDYFANVDPRLTNVMNTFYPGLTNQQIALYTANITV
jgi:hypothetical protein